MKPYELEFIVTKINVDWRSFLPNVSVLSSKTTEKSLRKSMAVAKSLNFQSTDGALSEMNQNLFTKATGVIIAACKYSQKLFKTVHFSY